VIAERFMGKTPMTVIVKVCGGRPDADGAAHTGAGVRQWRMRCGEVARPFAAPVISKS
jgi:hypothetical protein